MNELSEKEMKFSSALNILISDLIKEKINVLRISDILSVQVDRLQENSTEDEVEQYWDIQENGNSSKFYR